MYEKVLERFQKWVTYNFDMTNEKIILKLKHIQSVLSYTTSIVQQEKLSDEDVELAKIIAILHDCARFPQIKLFNSFDDTHYNHSIEGGRLLGNGLLKEMLPETRMYDDIIVTAVTLHGALLLPTNLDERTYLHCELIRDADRTDIFYLCVENFDMLFWSEKGSTTLTKKVKKLYSEGKPILFKELTSQLDLLALRLGLLKQYKFKGALRFIKEQNFVNRICDLFLEKRPYYDKKDVEWLRNTANAFLYNQTKRTLD